MSTSASEEVEEAKELSLVGKVELRLALAESDTKLEATLKTYLAPLLLKLASRHSSVRNKVSTLYWYKVYFRTAGDKWKLQKRYRSA